ncbi:phenylalanine--tRNA ligase subunit beta [Capnocytophaga sp. oral taxon 338]|uniref:phenylalanine--tRNA ligase subunit beta n=1 Tax=Capnocytophaga sp. oral taxon 338 TaxID=710239 RepID=UPI000202F4F2|nr:phenylalanine--tRNA ligase subunit beta [Capnocytophaga sp. oral taxon 338]EGD33649.1 phenylalanyl-tRNA synthetase beta subunit [Capnocytophaga sp. oral taxon 338 str. F0234]
MKISYNWIKDFLKIDLPKEKVGEILTDLGLEVEGITTYESIKGGLAGVVVGEVLECVKHPNADKLSLTKVDLGEGGVVPIVCGAPNVAQGQKVAVATIGTTLYDKEGVPFKIKKGKIRGKESFGMICAEDELGLGDNHEGIIVLENTLPNGKPCGEVFNVVSDVIFEIGLTPNRADAMSHLGVARDLRAGLLQQGINKEIITPSVTDFFVNNRLLKIDVLVDNKELAPRYCGVSISNIKVAPSPAWLQNRLRAIGIIPKNNVVDATNYVLHDLGQPLHVFDALHISGKKIIVRNATEGERIQTLDGVDRSLSAEDLVICDMDKPLCLAGVLGGNNSGVSQDTTHIFLESAYFNPIAIRKTAKRYGISTDASFRFERGINVDTCKYALLRAAILIKKLAGGEISSDVIDFYPKKIEDFKVFLTYEKIDNLIGQVIPRDEIKSILHSLDIQINSITEIGMGLTVPSYRVDVQRDVDVIEEILRVYGYNKIEYSSKVSATMAHSSKYEDTNIQNIIGAQLAGQGFFEIMNNSLTTAKYNELSTDIDPNQAVAILNPLSQDLAVMRQNMLFSGLETIAYNNNRKRSDLALFEFGKTYHRIGDNFEEPKHLTLFLTGNVYPEMWNAPTQRTNFYYLKAYIMRILERLGIKEVVESPTDESVFQEGIQLSLGKIHLASLGEVKRSILNYFDIKQEVFFADISWDKVLENLSKKVFYTEIPKYPEVRRDLALLLDENVLFEQLYQIAFKTEKELLKKVSLFDVYQGDKLPKGKKSYALSFVLQDKNKTLTDKQIDKVMNVLLDTFSKEVGAELRS